MRTEIRWGGGNRWPSRKEAALLDAEPTASLAEVAKRLGCSSAAAYRKRSRLLSERRTRRKWSVQALADASGFDRRVVKRAVKSLGLTWRSNRRAGPGTRYWLSESQAAAVFEWFVSLMTRWSPKYAACSGCGTTGMNGRFRHKARGLCARCYARSQRGYAPCNRSVALVKA